ncbi:alpha/beta fold hydrolase [Desulfonatronum thioautotrophicum]|uniref:alpha/beta fold hydrolase n=1 Tax=Desulfonatronum thioautotrophicum TaxID=617001 RepID=UPI00069BF304|nr:alpha/beta hydrolase [Desulfonatronum thioautotrophicum]
MKIKNLLVGAVLSCFLLSMLNAQVQAGSVWPGMVESADGVPISYEVHGTGEPTLVFVHGWSCDGRYWWMQVPHFSKNHRVVVIDLAGHGHSGLGREDYAMDAFGEDVQAVVQEVGAEQVILVGHSMGGPVSVAAARLMPGRVIGVIGVDTFQDVSHPMTQKEFDSWMGLFQPDFAAGAAQFVRQMFIEKTDPSLRDWVVADISAAPQKVALSAMEHMLSDVVSGLALSAFDGLETPIVAINADLWPTNLEANRRHMHSFDAVIIEGTDHFLHMAEPEAFNRKLEDVIAGMVETWRGKE